MEKWSNGTYKPKAILQYSNTPIIRT
jgi:hypothetical protein